MTKQQHDRRTTQQPHHNNMTTKTTTQQQINDNTSQQSTTKRHDNKQNNNATTTQQQHNRRTTNQQQHDTTINNKNNNPTTNQQQHDTTINNETTTKTTKQQPKHKRATPPTKPQHKNDKTKLFLKIPLILKNSIVGYFSLDTLLEGKELVSTLVGFRPGGLLGISPIPIAVGEFGLLAGVFKPPLHKMFSGYVWNSSGPIKE